MKYKFIAEAHEGAFSVDEEVLGVIEEETEKEAAEELAASRPDLRLRWDYRARSYVIAGGRKVTVEYQN